MEKLTQGLTSAQGFCNVMNTNATTLKTETKATLTREETLEDGTVVTVEGMTPDAIKNLMNEQIASGAGEQEEISFVTPGGPELVYVNDSKINPVETKQLNGVVQCYNNAVAPVVPEVDFVVSNYEGDTTVTPGMAPSDNAIGGWAIKSGTAPYTFEQIATEGYDTTYFALALANNNAEFVLNIKTAIAGAVGSKIKVGAKLTDGAGKTLTVEQQIELTAPQS